MKHRKNIRLKDYNYSNEGAYFVTICVDGYKCVFGKIEKEKIILNNLGKKVFELWCELPNYNPNIILDEFVVMPNHLHGIILIMEKISRRAFN